MVIEGLPWSGFGNYLTNRSKFVPINETISSLHEISRGVPQGSILGPLLFSIYINDFHKSSDMISFILFANNSNLFIHILTLTYFFSNGEYRA